MEDIVIAEKVVAVTSLHRYRIARHQAVPESAGFGPAHSRGCPSEAGGEPGLGEPG